MSAWGELVETLAESDRVMALNEEGYQAYIKARDEANTAFCLHANRYGYREAQAAQKKVRGESK